MRFHFGVSFRLKTLKKFLFPILIGILAYFGLGGLFGCLQVHAYENFDTTYYLDYNDFYNSDSNYHGNDSLVFVLYNFLDYYRNNSDISNFELFINQCSSDSMCIYLFNKDSVIHNVNIYGSNFLNNKRYISSKVSLSTIQNSYVFILPFSSNYNVMNSAFFDRYKSCVIAQDNYSDNCTYNVNNVPFISRVLYNYDDINLFYLNGITSSTPMINNNDDYTFTNANLFYYSSFDLYFRTDSDTINNTGYFLKKVNIYGNTYNLTNRVYSYFDIINGYGNSIGNTNFDEYNQLSKIYVGSVPINHINDFSLDISFKYNSFDFVNNLSYNILYFGRKNNSTYYSYHLLNCSSNNIYNSVYDNSNKQASITIFPNGFTCSDDLSTYDYIYLYIDILYDSSLDNTIYNFDMDSDYGYPFMQNGVLLNFSGTYIYEKFTNLDPNFSILLSTSDSINYAYYRSYNKYIKSGDVKRSDNSIGSLSLNPFSFGSNFNTNGMIYNIPSSFGGLSNLDLFIHYNTIVSFSNNDVYTYYDSSNSLTSNTIVNDRINPNSNNYNVSYYFGVVNGFIDDISLSIISFSLLIQNFYNSLPIIFQTFIFVIFILMCMYFTYLLIRK